MRLAGDHSKVPSVAIPVTCHGARLSYCEALLAEDDLLRSYCDGRYPEDETLRTQCPLELRPLFKAVAKNYPTSGMLQPTYASAGFLRLIRGDDREITGSRKRSLAEGFPALHEVVSRSRWNRIPSELTALLEALTSKARWPTRCTEVKACLREMICTPGRLHATTFACMLLPLH